MKKMINIMLIYMIQKKVQKDLGMKLVNTYMI